MNEHKTKDSKERKLEESFDVKMRPFKLIVLLFLLVSFLTKEAYAMFEEKHSYFVSLDAPESVMVVEDKPAGIPATHPYAGKSYEGKNYIIGVSYPLDHGIINGQPPRPQWAFLTMGSNPPNDRNTKFQFVIKNWQIKSERGNVFKPIVEHEFEFKEKGFMQIEDILGREFAYDKGFDETFIFYYDIPSKVIGISIELEIEIISQDGQRETVKDTIPLKRATYKIKKNFWDAFFGF